MEKRRKYISIHIIGISLIVLGIIYKYQFTNGFNQQNSHTSNTLIEFEVVDDISKIDFSYTKTPIVSSVDSFSLIATGDVMVGRSVNTATTQKGDFLWAFQDIAGFLRSADLTFVNLESPLVEECPLTDEGMIFCGDVRHIRGLNFAGVDIASVANNHAMNYGQSGFKETVDELELHGILPVGNDNPKVMLINDTSVAFLAYDDVECNNTGVACADLDVIKTDIESVKKFTDLIIIMFSWGEEYTYDITSRQKLLAHSSIDYGADIILGNHPHWFQPVEFYDGKMIIYSHGNLVFDQMWSEETRIGIVSNLEIWKGHIVDVNFIPIKIYEFGRAEIMNEEEGTAVLEKLEEISINL